LIFASLLSACASAPNPKTSDTGKAADAQQASPAAPSATSAQRADTKLNVQFDWWKLLQSSQLNSLIEQSFAAYPTLDSAQAALLKTQQSDIARSGYFHSGISVNTSANGLNRLAMLQGQPDTADKRFIGEAYYGLHARQLAIAYLPEALRVSPISLPKSTAEMKQLQMEATYRTLASNLVAGLLQDASLRAQMNTARKVVAIDQSLLTILRKQLKAGLATPADIAAQQTSAEHSAQALASIKKQFGQTQELLHILLGVPQNTDLPQPLDLAALQLLQELPLEVPAALIEQRPDARAAQLEMLPASTQYQNTMNVALKNTEDTLVSIYNDAIALKAAIASEQESTIALESMRKRYSANTANYQDVISAEQSLQLAKLRLVQTRTQHLGDAVALYHAVGGAWWNDSIDLAIASELKQKTAP
jgi:outer membrane protein TolC